MRNGEILALMFTLLGCGRPPSPGTDAERNVVATAPSVEAVDLPRKGAGPQPPLPAGTAPCSDTARGISCFRFHSEEEAFRWVLAHDPAILSVGEAHAQKGTEGVASATKRFTDTMLPLLADRASDLLVEAWAPNAKCNREVKAVAGAQKPIQDAQAKTNPNEYLNLGYRAKALGIVPDLLRPSCDDYASLANAGEDAVVASLDLIKRLTEQDATRLYRRNEATGKRQMVVTYGGAMHNDLSPSEALSKFSFGPELARSTGGRYIELDLIVPEYIRAEVAWERLPWYAAFRAAGGRADRPILYCLSERSFVLVFAASSTDPSNKPSVR